MTVGNEIFTLNKGMLVAEGSCSHWYVLVKINYDFLTKDTYLSCVCDYADNIYVINAKDVEEYATVRDVLNRNIKIKNKNNIHLLKRNVIDVMLSVVNGEKDNSFND